MNTRANSANIQTSNVEQRSTALVYVMRKNLSSAQANLLASLKRYDGLGLHLRLLSLCVLITCCILSTSARAAEPTHTGPDVVVIASEDKIVYEFRQNGQLRMVRVVPNWGKPYYLVPADPTKGFGDLERADMLIPQWVIAEF